MQPPEVFRLLTRQMPHRVTIFQLLSFAFMVCSIMALVYWRSLPWAIAAFLTSFLFITGWVLIRQKCINAWKISQTPHLVYWAHPARAKDNLVSDEAIDNCKLLTLHLRDGTQFQARLSTIEMRNFIAWLSKRNSSVRWGAYDTIA